MNKINYRIILDAHKGGVQKVLRGFFVGDVASRRISVNLSAGGASYAFGDGMQAIMYVTKGNGVTNYGKCEIVDNTVVYDVLQADTDVAGTVEMQLKVFDDDIVLYSPMFALEVQDAKNSDTEAETSPQFTALEEMLRKAQYVYDTRLVSIELRDDLVFIATYADGSTYESNALTKALEKEISLITPMGDWNAETTYRYLNLVNHGGTAWLCKEECKGEEPTDDNQRYWQRHGSTVDLGPIISGEVQVGNAKTVNGFSIYPSSLMICGDYYIPEIVRMMPGNSMLIEKISVGYLTANNRLPSGAAMIEIIKPEVAGGKTKVTCMVGYNTQKVGIYLCDLDEENHRINGWIKIGDSGDAETLDGYTSDKIYKVMRILTSEDDMNTLFEFGLYYYTSSDIPKNAPYQNASFVEVIRFNDNRQIQRVTRAGVSAYSAERVYSGSWQEWAYNVNDRNIGQYALPLKGNGGTVEYTAYDAIKLKRKTTVDSGIVGIKFGNDNGDIGMLGFKSGKLCRVDPGGTVSSEILDASNIANYALTSNGERKISAPEGRVLTLENTSDDWAGIAFTGTNRNSGETFETLIQADRTGASIVPSGTNIAYRILHQGNFASVPVWVDEDAPPTIDHVWIDTSE